MIKDELIPIGIMRRPHGKQGELLLAFAGSRYADWWEANAPEFVFLSIENIPVPWRVTDWRFRDDDTLIVRLRGVEDEATATRLSGCEAALPRVTDGAEAGSGTPAVWSDFRQWTVLDTDGTAAGVIEAVDETTANTLFILDNGRLLPAHEDLITAVDMEHKTLTMNIPEGL